MSDFYSLILNLNCLLWFHNQKHIPLNEIAKFIVSDNLQPMVFRVAAASILVNKLLNTDCALSVTITVKATQGNALPAGPAVSTQSSI